MFICPSLFLSNHLFPRFSNPVYLSPCASSGICSVMVSCCHCNIYSCLYLPRSKKNPHLLSFLISCRAFGSGATAEFVRVTEPAMGPVNWFSWLDSGLCRGVFLTRNKRCVLSLLATVWKWDSKFAQEMALFRRKLFPHPVGSKSLTPASPSSSSITLPVLPHGPQSASLLLASP